MAGIVSAAGMAGTVFAADFSAGWSELDLVDAGKVSQSRETPGVTPDSHPKSWQPLWFGQSESIVKVRGSGSIIKVRGSCRVGTPPGVTPLHQWPQQGRSRLRVVWSTLASPQTATSSLGWWCDSSAAGNLLGRNNMRELRRPWNA